VQMDKAMIVFPPTLNMVDVSSHGYLQDY
jgi:hypothetical protein